METFIDLDLNYNNVQSDVLKKTNRRRDDVYQDIVQYSTGMTKDQYEVQEVLDTSSVEGNKLQGWLDTIKDVGKGVQDYGATREGENIGERVRTGGMKDNQPPTEVTILGMKPLVFSLVSLGLVIGIGIGIARLGKNK